jgi:HSP20 family protein
MSKVQLPDVFTNDPFEDMFRGFFRPVRWEGAPQTPQIKVDVSEDDKAFVVKAEIPGVKKEDIDVRVDGGQLTISAEVKKESDEKKEGRVLRSERYYGYVSRAFSLGSEIDQGKVDASYNDGVLQLTLPKKGSTEVQRIAVK